MKLKIDASKTLLLMTLFIAWTLAFPIAVTAEDPHPDLVEHLETNVNAGHIFSLIDRLSSEEFEGRLTGSTGYNKAAAFAARYFKENGCQPIFDSYFQFFPLNYTKVYESALELTLTNEKGEKETIKGEYFTHFYPLLFSGSGDVNAPIVFAGYGITAPEYGYDDYQGIDVTGKIVMILRGEPKKKDGEKWERYQQHRHRTQNAKKHGAAALIYVRGGLATPNGDYIEGFPMVTVTNDIGDKILAAKGLDQKKVKETLSARKPHSFLTGNTAHIIVKSENFETHGKNVVAYLPGSDPKLKEEFILVGAHLDHCGMWPVLKPGADDNGSGSAACLATAKALGAWPHRPKRSILFVLFGGEEMGLLGSKFISEHLPPSVKPENIKFCINMDMVGAGPNMFVLGLKNHSYFEEIVQNAHKKLQLNSKLTGNELKEPFRANADHYPFAVRGIPAVSVFSGGGDHHGYHSKDDTGYWITPKITEDIVKVVGYTVINLADRL